MHRFSYWYRLGGSSIGSQCETRRYYQSILRTDVDLLAKYWTFVVAVGTLYVVQEQGSACD